MTPEKLVTLDLNQIDAAASVLTRAFSSDPLFTYFFPTVEGRTKKLQTYFTVMIRYGLSNGEVVATSNELEAVAIWLPPGRTGYSTGAMIVSGAQQMAVSFGVVPVAKMLRFSHYANRVHDRRAPFKHWYLQTIGVEPSAQGQGYASLLLRSQMERLDRNGLRCYLDTQSVRNVAIYEHYGFKVVEKLTLPHTDVSSWAMLRKIKRFD
jgi:ribosomal protein S18 acetylase RimI-like enzyme